MPAIALLGAQWGDEGKGKATDLLGEQVDYVVKFNGGNNAGHTIVIGDEKYALHLLPSGHPDARASYPVIGNGVVIDLGVLFGRDRRDHGARRRLLAARRVGQRARHHAVPHADGQGRRAVPRQVEDRHDRARDRPGVRRQDVAARRAGRRTCSTRRSCGRRSRARSSRRTRCWSRSTTARRSSVDEVVDELLTLRRAAAADGRGHRRCCSSRRSTPARSCCSRPARRRCSTSTTAPIRS